jgi:hypothetical protein
MFREFSHPSSGDQWCSGSFWFLPSYRDDSRAVFVVVLAGHPDHEHSTAVITIRR